MYQLFKPATLSVAVLGLMSASVWAEQSDSEPSVTLEPMIVSVSGVGRTLEKGPGSVTSINADEIRHIGANNMADVVKFNRLWQRHLRPKPAAMHGMVQARQAIIFVAWMVTAWD